MSRKHFVAAAAQVKAMHAFPGPLVANHVANAYADLFAQFNGNFDRQRFMTACGL